MRIRGYSFNSAVCCPGCTVAAFDSGELTRDWRTPAVPDEHRLPQDMTNTNKERVIPIFTTDPYGYTCDTCGGEV